ncbi:diguanylate cyclase [uncultured Cetobacterium sp.]|uniref:diguanylate cyclase n=1 Tax=uncultured Cetobacterium sp. TaxID=527638 RepID=UPI00263657C3|nr:diguanylate cyclase [uncultured Cetobacterium sp.]
MEHITKDSLTGLETRTSLKKIIRKNKKVQGHLILIDIDRFKEVNNRYSYYIEDRIIVKISKILKNIFFKQKIFRVSNTEFLIFLDDIYIETYLEKTKNRVGKIQKKKRINNTFKHRILFKKK